MKKIFWLTVIVLAGIGIPFYIAYNVKGDFWLIFMGAMMIIQSLVNIVAFIRSERKKKVITLNATK
ncbi:hypothetical protein [Mucilaginibacter sp.]|uniref:hypothetical protein n=1 Tax=Mucilaginibacter sp. TaxID=1882438 RepID=UPI0026267C13|nr:hypothetical protein [Mucilaginibacter sp.]